MATGASPAVVSQLSDVVPPAAVTVDPARSAVPSYSAHAAPATTPSSGPRIGTRLRWLAALPAGAETAREVVVMRHCAMTWTLGSQHTWCTDITLSECGGLAVRLGGQRVAGRRCAQRTRPPVWAAEGCEFVGYRQAADACGECADCGRGDHLGGAAGNIRDRFGWVAG